MLDPAQSDVGKQLIDPSDDDLMLHSVIGVRSPNTVLKRANALLMYYRWHVINGQSSFLPFDEVDVWNYVLSQSKCHSSATRSQSFLSALRFAHVMEFKGRFVEVASSRRVIGQSHIQMSMKSPTKQARPLTVVEVKKLRAVSEDMTRTLVDRCIASNLLFALYGRCQMSDLSHVHEGLHDQSGASGFMEVTTRHHKRSQIRPAEGDGVAHCCVKCRTQRH